MGGNIIRHNKTDTDERYYTIYSLENGYLWYLFLELAEDGKYYIFYGESVSVNDNWAWLKNKVFDYDLPDAVLGDTLPKEYDIEYYPAEYLQAINESCLIEYGEIMGRIGIYQDDIGLYGDISSVWRCIQRRYLVTDPETKHSRQEVCVYDLIIMNDGTGTLHYRCYIAGFGYQVVFTLDDEVFIDLDSEAVAAFQSVVDSADFWKIPTWNPEELTGCDGETTYIYGEMSEDQMPHLIAMWQSWERHGIYRIRTAIENIVKENIEVISDGT